MAVELTVHVMDREGNPYRIKWEPEQSLMEAIRDSDLPVLASCGGCRACATCHVHVAPEWFPAVATREAEELELLQESASFRVESSRLSCQVPYSEELDGIAVALAPDE